MSRRPRRSPAKALEPALAAQGRPQPRPLPARPAMPSPITPGGAPAARATVTRLPERHALPARRAALGPSPAANAVGGRQSGPRRGRGSAPGALAALRSGAVAPATPAHNPPAAARRRPRRRPPAHIPPAASVKARRNRSADVCEGRTQDRPSSAATAEPPPFGPPSGRIRRQCVIGREASAKDGGPIWRPRVAGSGNGAPARTREPVI